MVEKYKRDIIPDLFVPLPFISRIRDSVLLGGGEEIVLFWFLAQRKCKEEVRAG